MVANRTWIGEAIQRVAEDLDDDQMEALLKDLILLPGATASVKDTLHRMLEQMRKDAN